MVVIKHVSFGRLLVDTIFAAVMLAVVVYFEFFAPPYERGASCADTSLNYPYKPITVSLANAIVVGAVASIASRERAHHARQPIHEYVTRAAHRAHRTRTVVPYVAYTGKYLAYFAHGALAQFLIVCTLKVCLGRLRPDFYDVCQPTNATVDYCKSHPNDYVDIINCTYISREVFVWGSTENWSYSITVRLSVCPCLYPHTHSIRMSFPSGHASWCAYTAIYVCVYAQYRAAWRACGSRAPVASAQLAVLVAAVIVCATRVTDYQHYFTDVLFGAWLGAMFALITIFVAGVHTDAAIYEGVLRVACKVCTMCADDRARVHSHEYGSNADARTDSLLSEQRSTDMSAPTDLFHATTDDDKR